MPAEDFKEESRRGIQPTRNLQFLQFSFSAACMKIGQNSSRTSHDARIRLTGKQQTLRQARYVICDEGSKRVATTTTTTTTTTAAAATTTSSTAAAAAAAAAATADTTTTTTTTNSYIAQCPVKTYELAALYIINININMTIKRPQL